MSLPSSPMANRLIKPTLKTKFHVDFDWWERESREFRVYLTSHLCAEHRPAFAEQDGGEVVDVDRKSVV